jgi:lipopolysaccharide export system permease protein
MILYRYIIREHILPFLYSFSIIMFLFVMQLAVELLDKILAKGLDLRVVFEIFVLNLAWMVALAVPMAILTASLWTFGRMSADNEIMAIKASGQNLFFLITPVFISAAAIALMLVFFNNLVYPDANHKAANLQADIARKKPAALIEPRVLISDFQDHVLYVERVHARSGKLWGIKIFTDRPGDDPTTTVADSGLIQTTRDERYLQLTLYNGESHSISRQNPEEYFVGRFEKQVLFIDNVDSEFRRTERNYRGDREKSAQTMLAEIQGFRERKQSLKKEHDEEMDSLVAFARRVATESLSADTAGADTLIPRKSVDRAGREVHLDTAGFSDFAEVALSADSAASPDSIAAEAAAITVADTTDSTLSLASFTAWLETMPDGHSRAKAEIQRRHAALERSTRAINREEMRISQYLVEVHKKYAIPVACIVFVLIGAPLGIMARRGGITVAASYSIFFFVLYWAFLIGGEIMADKLLVSPGIAMWSANVIIGICGMILIFKMVREATFISFGPIKRFFGKLFKHESKHSHGRSPLHRIVLSVPMWLLNKAAGILPVYLLRLFVVNLITVMVSLIVIFISVDYISNLRTFESATFRDVAWYYWNYLPWYIKLMFPIANLLASMFAMGGLAKHSELTAIKAAGINIRRFTLPMLFLAALFAAGEFYLGEIVLPTANEQRKEVYQRIRDGRSGNPEKRRRARNFYRNFYYFGDENTVYRFQEFRTKPQQSRNVWRERFSDSTIVERIHAEALLYRDGTWFFTDGQRRVFDGEESRIVPFDTLPDSDLSANPQEMVTEIKSIDEMSYWELSEAIEKVRRRGEKVQKYLADLNFKIALPFMNIIVILLGISITALAGRKGGAVLFGTGLLLSFAYWVLARVGLALGQNDRLDPLLAAWLGNIVFALIALALYRKAAR